MADPKPPSEKQPPKKLRPAEKKLHGDQTKPTTPAAAAKPTPRYEGKLSFDAALDIPGLFNHLDTNNFGESYDPHSTTMFAALRSLIKEKYIPDAVDKSGPFRAICIDVIDDGTGVLNDGAYVFEPGSAEHLITRMTAASIEPRPRIRARVPGLDIIPKPLGAMNGKRSARQQDFIDAHTVFTAVKKGKAPKVGDLVYVDWRYKPKNGPWKDPILIGLVNETSTMSMEELIKALAAFLAACAGLQGKGDGTGPGSGSTGKAKSIPKSLKFSPTGRVVVPKRVWDMSIVGKKAPGKKARYVYYLADKQWNAQNVGVFKGAKGKFINVLREYWNIERLQKLTIYASIKTGLGAAQAWIVWGVMYGECKWKPVGGFGNNPAAAEKFAWDTGYGCGQFITGRMRGEIKKDKKGLLVHDPAITPVAKLIAPAGNVGNEARCNDGILDLKGGPPPYKGYIPNAGPKFEHCDLIDPYVTIITIAASYRRLVHDKFKGKVTPEALGAWWAATKYINLTGPDFAQKCPGCARKMKHILDKGPHLTKSLPKHKGWTLKSPEMQEFMKVLKDRPIPAYITYKKWTEEQTAIHKAIDASPKVPPQFIGLTTDKDPAKNNIPFDIRTKFTIPNDKNQHALVAPLTLKGATGETWWQISGPYIEAKASTFVVGDAAFQKLGITTPAEKEKAEKEAKAAAKKKEADEKKAKAEKEAAEKKKTEKTKEQKTEEKKQKAAADKPKTPKGNVPKATIQPLKSVAPVTIAAAGSVAQLPSSLSPQALQALCATLGTGGATPAVDPNVPGAAAPGANRQPAVAQGGSVAPARLMTAFVSMQDYAKGRGKPFRSWWKGNCLQFAAKLAYETGSQLIKTGKATSRKYSPCKISIGGYLPVLKSADGKRYGAGLTMRQLSAQGEKDGSLKPGHIVHVKVHWEKLGRGGYHRRHDFHHWMTYVGNHQWLDSFANAKAGQTRSSAKCDGFLVWWVGNAAFDWQKRTAKKMKKKGIPEADPQYSAAMAAAKKKYEHVRVRFGGNRKGAQARVTGVFRAY